ncbi:MAG: hypothetical protein ACXQTI_02180 [Candidatus Nezhaarchaeales archaeon]
MLEKYYPILDRKTPILDVLKRRPTFILDEPLVKKLNPTLLSGQVVLPPGITREEAIEVVAASEWATNLAAGWLKRFFPELTPGTPEYKRKKAEIARIVAAGIV